MLSAFLAYLKLALPRLPYLFDARFVKMLNFAQLVN
jgi:hypothetical protein